MLRKILIISILCCAVNYLYAPGVFAKSKKDKAIDHYSRGCELQGFGLLDKAIEEYQKALTIEPDFKEARFNLGIIYESQKQWQKAEEEYKKILKIDPNFYLVYNNLGLVYLQNKQSEKATECWQKAIRANPNQPEVYNNLGMAFLDLKQLDKAMTCYIEAANNRAFTLTMKGNFKAAEDQYEKITRANSLEPVAFYNYGIFYINRQKYNKAIEMLEKAVKIRSDFAEAHSYMGIALAHSGNTTRALDEAKLASTLKPASALIIGNLGLIYAIMGR